MSQHTAVFSHEFDAGPLGPARSYWDIRRDTKTVLTSLCLHPQRDMALLEAQSVCHALDQAFQAGRVAKAAEMRAVLGCKGSGLL